MLKLEKKSDNRPVNVKMRMNSRICTPTFLRALAIAVGIHLMGYLIFHVKPFNVGSFETIFPPVQVNIDMQQMLNGGVLANLEGEGQSTAAILEPKSSVPTIPLLSTPEMKRELAYPREKTVKRNPFQHMEENLDYLTLENLSPPQPKKGRRIKVSAFGNLSNKEIVAEGWEGKKLFRRHAFEERNTQYLATYDVKVEDRTGKIFWHQQHEPLEKKKLNVLAEKVLENLLFDRDPNGFISEGQIEIVFTISEQER
ncbi:MAG: hypothetical protein K940chlam7_00086 [Chlamydiae bacterium]|nr:hypothetical protein [Chlamydiota bacterium]